ncbi:hypothetical protein EV175_007626, partial [Coemansia sp. RSA 1933]
RFEVNLYPLRLQLSHDIAQKLINYLYPPQDNNSSNTSGGNATENGQGLAVQQGGGATTPGPEGASRGAMASETQSPFSSTGPGAMSSVNNTGGTKPLFASRLRRNLDDPKRTTPGSSARTTPGPLTSLSATPEPDNQALAKSPLQGPNALSPYSGR